jgi:aspartate ammonia-lyase
MENFRKESDLLGELEVPVNAYYGVQTQRAINNFKISGQLLSSYPEFIRVGFCKKAAAKPIMSWVCWMKIYILPLLKFVMN